MSAPGPLRQALIGVGANLGDRRGTMLAALQKLRATPGVAWMERSAFYETEPVGLTQQPAFLNLVAGVWTMLAPEALLAALREIEQALGRERTVRWGPRTIDLDLLAFEGEVRTEEHLVLPHPRMMERDFVKVPLRELLARKEFRTKWADLCADLGEAEESRGVRRLTDE